MFIEEENILKVLNAYNPWWKSGQISKEYQKPVKRKAFYEVKKTIEHNDIRRFVVLTGARRVGKTTILYQEIEELLNQGIHGSNILYVSFDNPILKFCSFNDIIEIYKNNVATSREIYLFLDEIQYTKDWNSWLKVLYDTDKYVSAVATGSASPLITKGSAESGTGRWLTISVPTLSFYEYCILKQIKINDETIPPIEEFKNLTDKKFHEIINTLSDIKREFNRYLVIGGFPELVLANDEKYAQNVLREDIVDKVLKRDLPELYNIRNIAILEKVFLYLCFNSSNIINFSNMSKILDNTSVQTLQEYIRYLESANLIYINNPISNGGEAILKAKPKIYISDSAIRNAVLMQSDILSDSKEMGYVVETTVFRHVYTYYDKERIGYYRNKNKQDKEIDIIVDCIKNKKFIEIKYREDTEIDDSNPIYDLPNDKDDIYIITKKDTDYGIKKCRNGNKIVRIPAYVYLYILGKTEYQR